MFALLPALVLALVWAWPRLSWACPSCGANNDAGGTTLLLIMGMIVLPWLVSWVVYRVIKRTKIFGTEAGELARELHPESRDSRRTPA